MTLEALGWSPEWLNTWSAAPHGCTPARVVTEDKHSFTVVIEEGPLTGILPGRLLRQRHKPEALPKVGDWVAIERVPGEDKGIIQFILPRRSRILRKVTGRESTEQLLAANVDVAFITQGIDQPVNLRRLERFLIMIHEGNVRPIILLNKCDLCSDTDAAISDARSVARDCPIVLVSAKTGKGLGILRKSMSPAATHVFIGTSGVGKSSLINRLYGDQIQATLDVRERDAKGRHSTTTRELIPLPCGSLVIDTPGMREFHLWEADTGLHEAFPDITNLASQCRFRDCRHRHETECAVKAAVLAGSISTNRHESYLKLQEELAKVTTGIVDASRKRPTRRRPHEKNDDNEDED